MSSDPYLWLEDVTGDDALDWVRRHNEPTLADLGDDEFEAMRNEALQVLDTDARIPYVRRRGDYLYNFWRDEANPRGLWQRTTLESYRSDTPDWDVVIDVDALAAADGENWVWAGADVIEPDHALALISLSRGGADAVVVREFDMRTREFVKGGFELPEAKTQITWADENTVLVGTDFGPGSLTDSGYARLVKRWRRGETLADAVTVYSGEQADVLVAASVDRTPGFERTMISRAVDFFNDEIYELRGDELLRVDAPTERQRLGAPRLVAHRAAHRLGRVCRRLTAGGQLCRVHRGHKESDRGVRAGCPHQPAPVLVDPRQTRRGHTCRCRQPRADLHPRRVDGGRAGRGAAQHQHGDRRRRLTR